MASQLVQHPDQCTDLKSEGFKCSNVASFYAGLVHQIRDPLQCKLLRLAIHLCECSYSVFEWVMTVAVGYDAVADIAMNSASSHFR